MYRCLIFFIYINMWIIIVFGSIFCNFGNYDSMRLCFVLHIRHVVRWCSRFDKRICVKFDGWNHPYDKMCVEWEGSIFRGLICIDSPCKMSKVQSSAIDEPNYIKNIIKLYIIIFIKFYLIIIILKYD